MANQQLSEQEILRRESMTRLRELGIEPYPAPLYPVNATAKAILEGYKPEEGNFSDVCIAGRIMSRRIMGAASFMELQDESVNLTPLIKSMSGFYILSTEDRATSESLYADVKKFVKSGRYELLMETKDDGQVLRMYTVGDEKTVESFVMVTKEDSEVSVISFDGKMDREQMENILAEAAR
jgi:lysyl-tRNA synthetase class II